MRSPSTIDGRTLPEIFLKRVALSADQRAYLVKRDGQYQPILWKEIYEQSLGLFRSLRAQGVEKGDRVAILSNSRPEWAIADITILTTGAATIPIYQSSTAEDIAFVLSHSGTKLVFAEDAKQAEKLNAAFQELGKTLPVVFFDAGVKAPFPSFTYEEFSKVTNRAAVVREQKASVENIGPKDLATIIYTSGTTGRPKGARLLHEAWTAELRSIAQDIEVTQDDLTLAFLPFAHVFGRVESLIGILAGVTIAFAENVASVSANLVEVQPTILLSVPRIYEKIYAKMMADIDAGPEYRKQLFKWAMQVGREVARFRSNKDSIPLRTQIKFQVADQLVFSKVREKMGGRLRFTVSGGAPLARELCEFFHACGVRVLEAYGLTETTGAIAANRPNDYRFGTVGRPFARTDYRIADDGEIQVRGPAVFDGYHDDDKATREAMTEDGWFCTGDIGEFDDRGFLRITDRKKELIITAGGKNIAPQKLENLLKQIPLVSQALVYGDKQKYLVALITLADSDAKRWAKQRNISFENMEELVENGEVLEHLERGIKAINQDLASYETIKKFKVLPNDFTLEAGEITPSLKLKRKVISQRYGKHIEQMY